LNRWSDESFRVEWRADVSRTSHMFDTIEAAIAGCNPLLQVRCASRALAVHC
jgi:hypothetical protein